jgi:hypothetical protein
MYDWNFAQKIQCDGEDKKECLKLLQKIVLLADKARKYGLLLLEADIDQTIPFLLRKGLELILSGTEPQLVKEILETYIYAGDLRGKELLAGSIIKEGVLLIQKGEHPWVVRERLAAFFGEDFAEMIEQFFGTGDQDDREKIQVFLDEIKGKPIYSPDTSLLEEPLAQMDHRSLQRALREVDMLDMVKAMKGASGKIQVIIFENLPHKLALLLKEALETIEQVNLSEIAESQNRMLETIQKLRAEGEIGG